MLNGVQTRKRTQELKKQGFYNNWPKRKFGLIVFRIYPGFEVKNYWFKKRSTIYRKNARLLKVKPPRVNFYLYPTKEAGIKMGILPFYSFPKLKEIHSHFNQSPGHELTHILFEKINKSGNKPKNKLWNEGLCTYLNGTKTNQKKHALSLNVKIESLNPFTEWMNRVPGDLYPIAGSIIQYIVKRFGWKKTLLFLKSLKNSLQYQNKMALKIFKSPINDLRKDWLKWLNRK